MATKKRAACAEGGNLRTVRQADIATRTALAKRPALIFAPRRAIPFAAVP